MKLSISTVVFNLLTITCVAQNMDKQEHYLVGLLNYPQAMIPEILQNHTSGTFIPVGDEM